MPGVRLTVASEQSRMADTSGGRDVAPGAVRGLGLRRD